MRCSGENSSRNAISASCRSRRPFRACRRRSGRCGRPSGRRSRACLRRSRRPRPFPAAAAASVSPRCWSISMPERIRAVGLTLFWPLYFGALPCVASNTAPSGPMFAPGATPRPPTRPAARSLSDVAVQVRQHQHVVQLGLLHELHAHVVDDAVFELDVRILLGHLPRPSPATGRRCTS